MSYYSAQGSFWDDVTSYAGKAVSTVSSVLQQKGAADAYKNVAMQQQQQPAQSQTPSWLLPALIGGGILLAVVVLKKK